MTAVLSDLDRATMKATALWAVAIVRTEREEKWREEPAEGESILHIAIAERIDEICWFLTEEQADRRIAELRKAGSTYASAVRKFEIAFGHRLEPGQAHQLCEAMAVAWAERAAKTRTA